MFQSYIQQTFETNTELDRNMRVRLQMHNLNVYQTIFWNRTHSFTSFIKPLTHSHPLSTPPHVQILYQTQHIHSNFTPSIKPPTHSHSLSNPSTHSHPLSNPNTFTVISHPLSNPPHIHTLYQTLPHIHTLYQTPTHSHSLSTPPPDIHTLYQTPNT